MGSIINPTYLVPENSVGGQWKTRGKSRKQSVWNPGRDFQRSFGTPSKTMNAFYQILSGESTNHLCVSWGIIVSVLASCGAILGHLRTIFGLFQGQIGVILGLLSWGRFGQFWGHLGTKSVLETSTQNCSAQSSPSWTIVDPILGANIGQVLVFVRSLLDQC